MRESGNWLRNFHRPALDAAPGALRNAETAPKGALAEPEPAADKPVVFDVPVFLFRFWHFNPLSSLL